MVRCTNCGWTGTHFEDHVEGIGLACPQCGFIRRDPNLIQYLQDAFPARRYGRLRCLEVSSSVTSPILKKKFPRLITMDIKPAKKEVYGDLMRLHYKDNWFDFIICLDVIEHVEDDVAAFKEMFRVLKPSGKVVLHTPPWSEKGEISSPEKINCPKYHMSNSEISDARVYRYYSCEKLPERMEAPGFKVKEIRFMDSGLMLHQDIFYELRKCARIDKVNGS